MCGGWLGCVRWRSFGAGQPSGGFFISPISPPSSSPSERGNSYSITAGSRSADSRLPPARCAEPAPQPDSAADDAGQGEHCSVVDQWLRSTGCAVPRSAGPSRTARTPPARRGRRPPGLRPRTQRDATVITSNRDFNEWPQVLANPLMASAAMDRLVHRAAKIRHAVQKLPHGQLRAALTGAAEAAGGAGLIAIQPEAGGQQGTLTHISICVDL